MFWSLKPLEMALANVSEIALDAGLDRASGIEVCNTMLVLRAGGGGLGAVGRRQEGRPGDGRGDPGFPRAEGIGRARPPRRSDWARWRSAQFALMPAAVVIFS